MEYIVKTTNELTKYELLQIGYLKSDDRRGSFYSSLMWIRIVLKKDKKKQNICLVKNDSKIILALLFDIFDEEESEHYNLKDLLNDYNPYFKHFKLSNKIDSNIYPVVTITLRSATTASALFDVSTSINELKTIYNNTLHFLKNYGNSICLLYVPEDADVLNLIDDSIFQKYFTGNRYYLEKPNWNNYLSQFRSKRRSRYKKYVDQIQYNNLNIERVEINNDNKEILITMVKNNFEKHGFIGFKKKYLRYELSCLNREIGEEDIYLHFLRFNSIVVGASLSFRFADVLYAFQIGFDYQKIEKEWNSYFILGIYNNIILGEKLQVSNIQFYDGLDLSKLHLGLKAEALYNFINTYDLQIEKSELDSMNDFYQNQYKFMKERYER